MGSSRRGKGNKKGVEQRDGYSSKEVIDELWYRQVYSWCAIATSVCDKPVYLNKMSTRMGAWWEVNVKTIGGIYLVNEELFIIL